MKNILLLFLILTGSLNCFSQTNPSDRIIKTFGKEQLQDCKVYDKYPNGKDTSILHHSYEFDLKGNICKEIFSTRWYDTSLVVSTFDSLNRKISQMRYTKSWQDIGKRDTSKWVYSYNDKNKITSELCYSYYYPERQNETQLLYFYNNSGLLEKIVFLEYYGKRGFDTTYTKQYTYNPKGLKETEIIRGYCDMYSLIMCQGGINKFKYDDLNRLTEINHIELHGKRNEIKDERMDFNRYYTYTGDSLITETTISQSTFCIITTLKDRSGKVIQTKRNFTQGLEIKNINEKYIHDQDKTGIIQIQNAVYKYDRFGRINKVAIEFDNRRLNPDGTDGLSYKVYKYKDDKSYLLDEDKYLDKY